MIISVVTLWIAVVELIMYFEAKKTQRKQRKGWKHPECGHPEKWFHQEISGQ